MINKKFWTFKPPLEEDRENYTLQTLTDYLYLLYLSQPHIYDRCLTLLVELKIKDLMAAKKREAKAKSSDEGATGSGAPASQEKKKGPEGQQD